MPEPRRRQRFRPRAIDLLLVAEAPPSAPDRYFYFPKVNAYDNLFRYVARFTVGTEPTRQNKDHSLGRMRDLGVFLVDVCPDPIFDSSELRNCVGDLVERVIALAPRQIILIKASVWDVAYLPLKRAGLPVVEDRVPFPGSGQQLRFEESFSHALDSIRWIPGKGLPPA